MPAYRGRQPETLTNQEDLVNLPETLTQTDAFLQEVRKTIEEEDLMSDEEMAELFKNPELVKRMMDVTQYAYAILGEPGREFAKLEKTSAATPALRRWETAAFDFYALTAPALDVNDVPAILRAEKHLKNKKIVRDGETIPLKSLSREETLWTSQNTNPRVVKSQLSEANIEFLATAGTSEEEKEENAKLREKLIRLREDIERWFGPAGLLLHTAVASWSIQTTVENLQHYIEDQVPEEKQTKWHKYLMDMHSKRARVWLNLHDLGRLITHDPHDHAVLTHVISKMAGLPDELCIDYDLSSILEFGSTTPKVEEFIPPKQNPDEPREDYIERVNVLRTKYVDDMLETIEEMGKEDQQYENPMSVMMFWLIDAYTKLYDIRGKRTLSSRTDHIDPREISENFDHYRNLQPGDEKALFLGRFQYRMDQGDSDPENMSEAEMKIYRYYSRQYELAKSIFVWLEERLGIPNELLWNLIFSFTERNDKHIDPNGDFSHHPADPHSDIWEAVVNNAYRNESVEDRSARLTTEAQESSKDLLQKIRSLLDKKQA